MRVLHLANGNLFGGIETFLVTLARLEQEDDGLRNSFILSHEGRLATELRDAGAPVRVLPGARVRKPWAVRKIRASCRLVAERQAPDLVVAHGPWAYYVFGHALSAGPAPVAFWQHGPAHRDLLHLLARRRRPSAVLANSQLTARTTELIFPGLRPRVLRLPVPEPRRGRSREAMRDELGAGKDVVVLQTSRFEWWKGHTLLLEALLRLRYLPWQLWLAGSQTRPGERRLAADLSKMASDCGFLSRLKFLGERRDIGDVLGAADIFCQPNIGEEPYGLGLLEAMAIGLPVVVTEPGATAIEVSSVWGRLVSVSSAALASALSELIGDPGLRERMGRLARAHHLEHQSSRRILAEMQAGLQSIAAGRA